MVYDLKDQNGLSQLVEVRGFYFISDICLEFPSNFYMLQTMIRAYPLGFL